VFRVVLGELLNRRSRTLALLAGILVATTAFTVLTGTSASQRLEVRGRVARSFRGDYDVLVRPRGSRSAFERRTGQVQPTFLSGVFGGISTAQWHRIQRLPGVEVAAPLANVGYVLATSRVPVDLSALAGRRGRVLLRTRVAWRTDRGLTRLPDASQYLYVTDRLLPNPGREHTGLSAYLADALRERPARGRRPVPVCPDTAYVEDLGAGGPFSWRARSHLTCSSRRPLAGGAPLGLYRAGDRIELQWSFPLLLSAIDPASEARLTGLDRAVVGGRYFEAREGTRRSRPIPDPTGEGPPFRNLLLPVLLAGRPLIDSEARLTIERLSRADAQGMLRRHWSEDDSLEVLRYLRRRAPGEVVARRAIAASQAYARLPRQLEDPLNDFYDGVLYRPGPTAYARRGHVLAARPAAPPGREVWGYTPGELGAQVPPGAQDVGFRSLMSVVPYGNSDANPGPTLSYRGTFDPARLRTTRTAGAAPGLVFEPPALRARTGRAARALGHRPLIAGDDPVGYLAQPPGLLTTLRAARVFTSSVFPQVLGDPPISAVRVRVAGVTGIDPVSRERIRQAAQRIAAATGLDVDVTAGASGAPTALDLPAGRFGRPALALTELWVRKGVATRVLSAIDRKSVALFVLILVVCGVFVANATGAAVRARRSELGILSSLGWSTGRLFGVVLGEVALIGAIAGVLGGLLALPLAALVGVDASPLRAAAAVPAAILLAVLAGLVPAARAARAEPIAAVRPAVLEVRRARRPRGVAGMALVNLLRTPGRTALGALSLAIGVCALTLLLAATLAFHDTLVGTLLGDAVAVEVRASDVIAVIATVALGVAAVADVLFLELRERAAEFATLTATGWDDRALTRLVALEGVAIGACGAVAGAAVGLAAAAAFAGALPGALLATTGAAALAGTALAGLAGLVPAAALRRTPAVALLAGE
jgi:putative ABC transport system permease protein